MQEYEIAFETISFPSDRITIGDIRRVWASRIAKAAASGDPLATSRILSSLPGLETEGILSDEQRLARKAFLAALGRPDDDPTNEREEMIESLAKDYVRFGLATGLEHTRQLVRTFEAAAAAQARSLLGKQI